MSERAQMEKERLEQRRLDFHQQVNTVVLDDDSDNEERHARVTTQFMLLFFHTGRLRVVISTANLVDYDWRNIENTVWVQDVPSPVAANPKVEDFASAMVRVLHGVNVAPALVNFLKNEPNLPLQRLEDLRTQWDFSCPPSPESTKTGRRPSRTCCAETAKDKDRELELECEGSSIGTYGTAWLNEFFCSAQGWLDKPKALRVKLHLPPGIRILFPMARYVRERVLGEQGGGTMFCRRTQWEGKNFPRELGSPRLPPPPPPPPPRAEIVLGIFQDKPSGSGRRKQTLTDSEDEAESGDRAEGGKPLAGWVYVGSYSFTPSAWGTLSGSGFNPMLNVDACVLGILLPLHSEEEIESVACWERPPQKYVIGRDEPWIQSESPAFVVDA
ncbi:hypothetical protein GSI_11427 [Ganoderma sinense ZZ0214-1]|uniref:Uncharacterized protein n=1 Tax=Ganoderma sinense ZZ0214-1 TaxID=1077348 RepID=A0A2G8RVZ9_9APHY|nr:hypothetical protein GSI_11427 [Ganoderma sinense ZZ0214-1]